MFIIIIPSCCWNLLLIDHVLLCLLKVFILISKRLNILSTIKSRSIIYRVRKSTPEELGVDKYVYNFFLGISNDIAEYKEQEIDLMLEKSYKSIAGVLKEYEKEKNIDSKRKQIGIFFTSI